MNVSSVFCIVPAFNEGSVIESVVMPLVEKDYSVVVVDDGSEDETWSVLERLPVYALRHRINLGQGAALQTGMDFALQRGADVIVHFDADGQHRCSEIESMIEPLLKDEADAVLGSRFLRREDRNSVPFVRRMFLRGAVMVNALLTGMWLTDAHNGFRAFKREAAEKIHVRENRYAHASEIVLQIRRKKIKWVEKPTRVQYTSYSMAKGQSLWNAVNVTLDMILRRIFR